MQQLFLINQRYTGWPKNRILNFFLKMWFLVPPLTETKCLNMNTQIAKILFGRRNFVVEEMEKNYWKNTRCQFQL